MKTLLLSLLTAASLTVAQAQTYTVLLDPAQDGGGARMGTGTITLNLTGNTLTLNGSFSGLSGNATLAHIHGPSGPFPSSAGVLYDLGGITTFGAPSGTINGAVNLILKPGDYTVAEQMADLNNAQWYVNIHSSTFGGGEIRGQITLVPEPGTWALAGLGLGSLLLWRRRRV
jgi:hypothetical protein